MTFVAFLLALGFIYLVIAARRKPNLTATITIAPSGQSLVVLHPDTHDGDALIRLMLCYATKVRWVIKSEPAQLTDVYRELILSVIEDFSTVGVRNLLTDVPLLAEIVKNTQRAPASVPGGEQFVVRMFYGNNDSAWVTNDLPRSGLSFNLAWHFPILVETIRSRLEQKDREWAQLALRNWYVRAFDPRDADQSLRSLKLLTDAANADMNQARKLA